MGGLNNIAKSLFKGGGVDFGQKWAKKIEVSETRCFFADIPASAAPAFLT